MKSDRETAEAAPAPHDDEELANALNDLCVATAELRLALFRVERALERLARE